MTKKGTPVSLNTYMTTAMMNRNISDDCKRLALVTVALDEKMHSSTSYLDLLALTKNWAMAFFNRIKQLKNSDFNIILTTDHGNVLAKGWRTFTQTEKVHLYGKASRGHRHAIFLQKDASNQFEKDLGYSIRCLHKQLWFAIRDDHSFNSAGRVEITHGGILKVPFHLQSCANLMDSQPIISHVAIIGETGNIGIMR